MVFQFKRQETVDEAVKRSVRREIEKSLAVLGPTGNRRLKRAEALQAVHEIRKSFKRVRAALRLVRDGLGDALYHEANFFFRDAARPLAALRDAEALLEATNKLADDRAGQIDAGVLANLRKHLRKNQTAVARQVLDDAGALHAVHLLALEALERVPRWKLRRDGWKAVASGIRRVYRDGRRARTTAKRKPTVENLHEWRKQAKYLWHHLQLLEPAWIDADAQLGERARALTQLLGEDHDLAMLELTLAADPLPFGGHGALDELFAQVDRQRRLLQEQAFALGQDLYAEPPAAFRARIKAHWRAWKGARPQHAKPTRPDR